MSQTARFDWPQMMRLGLRQLGMRPVEFWALTPIELMMMLGLDGQAGGSMRDRLNELLAAYPDEVPSPGAPGAGVGKGEQDD